MYDEVGNGRRPARRDMELDGHDTSLPDRRREGASPAPRDRAPARPDRDARVADVQFALEYGWPAREECWRRLPARVSSRLVDVAGTVEGWFARQSRNGSIDAVVFGHSALAIAIAVPRARGLDDDGYQYVLHRYEFEPSSLRSAHVRHQPPRATPSAGAGRAGSPDGGPDPHHAAGLSLDFVETLSGLPPRARALLEGPYLEHDDVVLRHHAYWEGSPDEDDLRPFILIMASARRAALGVGRRLIPPGHDRSTAHWQLSCWDARVVKRTER